MWKPNEEGVNELIRLFQDCNSSDNRIQTEIYNKLNVYSQEKDFSNYLVFIFTHSEIGSEIRQYAGLILKGLMERSFVNFTEDNIEYFKNKILKVYEEQNKIIKKTLSNLINTFIRHGGIEIWPELLNLLMVNLDKELNYEISIETIQILIEDSGSYIEDKFLEFIKSFINKILESLGKFIINTNDSNEKNFEKEIIITLTTLHILIENCPNAVFDEIQKISNFLININIIENIDIRINLGHCWNSLIKNKKELIPELGEILFNFFLNNFKLDNYELNFTAAEFFNFTTDEEEKTSNNEKVLELLEKNIKE